MTYILIFLAGLVVGWFLFSFVARAGFTRLCDTDKQLRKFLDGLGYDALVRLQRETRQELTKRGTPFD